MYNRTVVRNMLRNLNQAGTAFLVSLLFSFVVNEFMGNAGRDRIDLSSLCPLR